MLTLALALSGALATTSTAASAKPADVAAAVANAGARSEDNVKLDESRKPAEVLNFLGLKKGDQAIDLFGANRYWAEIMAPAVGPKGHVTVWEPTQFTARNWRKSSRRSSRRQATRTSSSRRSKSIALDANSYDFVMLNLNYHDVYWESAKYGVKRMEPDAFVKTVYASVKPGGVVGVIDHVGNPGDTRETVEKYHRIDPAVVKADFENAGFSWKARATCSRTLPTITRCWCSTTRSAERPTASSSSSGSRRIDRKSRGSRSIADTGRTPLHRPGCAGPRLARGCFRAARRRRLARTGAAGVGTDRRPLAQRIEDDRHPVGRRASGDRRCGGS